MPVKWDARDYARHSQLQQEFGLKHLAALELRGDESVLDIGCGDGKLTAELARKVPHGKVLAIDSSPEMIATARETHGAFHPNLSFQILDAAALDFDEQFDLIFSGSALHWVKDHVRLLAAMRRALRARGRIYLVFGGRGSVADVIRVMDAVTARPAWRSFFDGFEFRWSFFGPEEYREWVAGAGFVPEAVELLPRDVVHPTREAFEGWLRTTWMPYTHRVPAEQRPAFVREAADLYLELNPADAEGRIHVKMVSLLVKARRR